MSWKVPRYAAAVLDGLHLTHPTQDLASLSDPEWESALAFADRTRLTLVLGNRCASLLPPQVRQRIERNYAGNAQRMERLWRDYDELALALGRAKVEHVVLKGFTQSPRFTPDLNTRVQYDLDLFCPGDSLARARDAAAALGYETVSRSDDPTDHLPSMARRTGWQWRGDYYDPEIPVSLDLHFRLWDAGTEGFGPDGLDEFRARRETCRLHGRQVPVFAPPDALAYSALHLLRHVLRGSAQPYHVYEIACFLDRHAGDDIFWQGWRECHPASLRRLEAISFRLAVEWFGCRVPAAAQVEINELPDAVRAWFLRYAASPVEQLFHPNKDELWLHLCLLTGWRAGTTVLRRRLLPLRLPAHVDAVYVPQDRMTARLRLRKWYRYAKFLGSRLAFHLRAQVRTAAGGMAWLWILFICRRPDRGRQHEEVERKHAPVGEQIAR